MECGQEGIKGEEERRRTVKGIPEKEEQLEEGAEQEIKETGKAAKFRLKLQEEAGLRTPPPLASHLLCSWRYSKGNKKTFQYW